MMDFTAIDFETANRAPHSACQLAAVRVRGGRVVQTRCWLIRPKPFHFAPLNVQIHGIRPEAVEAEPEFCGCWPEIAAQLEGECLVAHNAQFDIGVLRACLVHHRLAIPELQFSCTKVISRAAWPKRYGYGLKALADWLGIRFQHHDALEDSLACAQVLLAAAQDVGAGTIEELEGTLSLSRGRAGPWGYQGANATKNHRTGRRW